MIPRLGIATHAKRTTGGVVCGQVCARICTLDWEQVNCVRCLRILRKARLTDQQIDRMARTVLEHLKRKDLEQ
jgi:hypothetical protein